MDRRGFKGHRDFKREYWVEQALSTPNADPVVLAIWAWLLRIDERKTEEIALLLDLERRARAGENVLLQYPKYRLLPIDEKPY